MSAAERDSDWSLQIYIYFSWRKVASECVLLQSFKVSPVVHHNTPAEPRKPCPAQPWIFSDFKLGFFGWFLCLLVVVLFWFGFCFNFGAVCRWFRLSGPGGFAYLLLKLCKGRRKERKPRLWLTPCDQAPSAQDLSSHKPTPQA